MSAVCLSVIFSHFPSLLQNHWVNFNQKESESQYFLRREKVITYFFKIQIAVIMISLLKLETVSEVSDVAPGPLFWNITYIYLIQEFCICKIAKLKIAILASIGIHLVISQDMGTQKMTHFWLSHIIGTRYWLT